MKTKRYRKVIKWQFTEETGKLYTLNELGDIIRKLEAKGKLSVTRKNGYPNTYSWFKVTSKRLVCFFALQKLY